MPELSQSRDMQDKGQRYARGKVEGLAEGHVKEARLMLVEAVQARFPALVERAQERAACTDDAAELRKLVVEIIKASNSSWTTWRLRLPR